MYHANEVKQKLVYFYYKISVFEIFNLDYCRYVQMRDAGLYECQVSTEPKLSHVFMLNVVGK